MRKKQVKATSGDCSKLNEREKSESKQVDLRSVKTAVGGRQKMHTRLTRAVLRLRTKMLHFFGVAPARSFTTSTGRFACTVLSVRGVSTAERVTVEDGK